MKVEFAETHVKGSHGLQEARAFNIKTTAHAFKLLSSGLYSDKIAAVLREIGCNAADAHVQGGVPDRPIEVKLPNRVDTQFYIRDWGPGLSHEDVMNLYTTYFASTKQDSNDYTGAFGLGSKSPFSYTDSFTVTSVHGGKKRTYSAHLDNKGSPTIALLTTEDAPADWPSGIMVGFPVKYGDFTTFEERAQSTFKWFRVPPKVVGAAAIHRVEVLTDAPDFMHVKDVGGVGVVMGNVYYPIHQQQFLGSGDTGAWLFNFAGIVLKVSIGDVNVAASREGLQYDKDTIAYLKARCNKMARTVADDVAAEARKVGAATWQERCKIGLLATRWRTGSGYFRWEEFFGACGLKDARQLASILMDRSVPVPAKCGTKTMFRVIKPTYNGKTRHTVVSEGTTKGRWDNEPASLDLNDSTAVYHGKASYALERVRQEVVKGNVAQAILITPHPLKAGTEADVATELAALQLQCRNIPTVDVATLPEPSNALKKRKSTSKVASTIPLPSTPVMVVGAKGGANVAINLLAQEDQTYMCRTPGYHYDVDDRGVRLFEKSAETDRVMSKRNWLDIWNTFQALQDELGISKSRNHAMLTAGEVRGLDIVKRKWPRTYDVVAEWAQDKAVRDAVATEAAKWRPTVSLTNNSPSWHMKLTHLRSNKPDTFDIIRPVLAASSLKLDAVIDSMFAASRAAGRKAGQNQPAAVTLYERLVRSLNLRDKAIAMPDVKGRGFLNPDQLEQDMVKAHPMLAQFDVNDLERMLGAPKDKLVQFAQFLFT